ncbi:MAG: HEAT repeat domain-containing protein [bacterium]|nr:HEAT repeat domain-containing protein [bacterium]
MIKRMTLGALAAFAVLALSASDVQAHGGQFRGPGGKVPPGLREPSDPTPPPPPPPSGPPTTPNQPNTPTTPNAPNGPTTPQPVGPVTPPPTGPQQPQARKGPASKGYEAWEFWWGNNKDRYLNLKSALYNNVSSESSIFEVGGRRDANRGDQLNDIRAKVDSTVIPALLWAMDPKNAGHQDTESAAYIALAKMATEWKHVELLMKGLDKKAKNNVLVEEACGLCFGLLRRTDEDQRFSASELDKVRTFMFKVFQSDDYNTRTRGFAAMSIGMLSDQPTGTKDYIDGLGSSTEQSSAELAARMATTNKLFDLLKGSYTNQDLYVALLMSIGLQQADSVTEPQRDVLRTCALKGTLFKDNVNRLVRAFATEQLGRIGTAKDVGVLMNVLNSRRTDPNVQRSAAIGLGQLGKLISAADRKNVAKLLLDVIGKRKVKDASAINFSYISLAYLVIEDFKAGKAEVMTTDVKKFLLKEAEDGRYIQRPFAAIALSLIGREITEEANDKVYADMHIAALDALRAGLASKKLDKSGRAAFALGLGLIRDDKSTKALEALVADSKEDPSLRGYAAVGIGLTGVAPKSAKLAVRSALKEKRSKEMRIQCATALGLMQDSEALPLLMEELQKSKAQSVKGQVVLAMAQIGTEKAVDPLVNLLKNKSGREQDLTRALACAGLGVIGDLEMIPTLARISANINYRASTDIVNEVLSII